MYLVSQDKCPSQYLLIISAKVHYVSLNSFLKDAEFNFASICVTCRKSNALVQFLDNGK